VAFDSDLFAFLGDLKRHNDRDWFAANRDRYVRSVEAPMLQFIGDVGTRLPEISPAFRADARRFGGSLYRMQRDTRFSPDKSPFKPWAAAIFRHRSARKGHQLPGFYLHVEPGHTFAGGGLYHPDQPTLTRIRQYMTGHVEDWQAVKASSVEIQGSRLTAGAGRLRQNASTGRRPEMEGPLQRRQVHGSRGRRAGLSRSLHRRVPAIGTARAISDARAGSRLVARAA
jgi:uncharacterized protein (TIGR02453 family)